MNTNVEDVEALAAYLKRGRKYVLLFDYIEESKGFNSDLPSILADKSGALVRVIANCRYTYTASSNFPAVLTFLQVHLDKGDEYQKKYEEAVIQHIIHEVQIDLGKDRLQFHLIKPSFAVFLRFLWYNNTIDLSSDIREVNDFKSWIKKRLRLTLGLEDFSLLDWEVIYSLTLMPAPRSHMYQSKSRKKFLQKLIDGRLGGGS